MRSATSGLLFFAAFLISSCSFSDDRLDLAAGSSEAAKAPTSLTTVPTASTSLKSDARPEGSLRPSSGSPDHAKAQAFEAELAQLQASLAHHQQQFFKARQDLAANAQEYFNTIAAIDARLQGGTTAGDPELISRRGKAEAQLDAMDGDLARMRALLSASAYDSSVSNYLLGELRSAFGAAGKAARDQGRHIEDDLRAAIERNAALGEAISKEIARQDAYVANERTSLLRLVGAIEKGELYNANAANSAVHATATANGLRESSHRTASDSPTERPYVIIRFDDPNVQYEQPLYKAVKNALERKPSAMFTIEAVAPNAGTAADISSQVMASRKNATAVLHSLTEMGVPRDRLSVAVKTSAKMLEDEVRIYVR